MDTVFSVFLLFIAAITAYISYLTIPDIPVVALMSAAAIALAVGVWWHWTQFSVDYRTSTWQEQLRSYGSYVMVVVVILLSYAFYVFTQSGGSVRQIQDTMRNTGRRATTSVARSLSSASNTLFSAATEPFAAGISFVKRNLTPAALVPTPAEGAGILE